MSPAWPPEGPVVPAWVQRRACTEGFPCSRPEAQAPERPPGAPGRAGTEWGAAGPAAPPRARTVPAHALGVAAARLPCRALRAAAGSKVMASSPGSDVRRGRWETLPAAPLGKGSIASPTAVCWPRRAGSSPLLRMAWQSVPGHEGGQSRRSRAPRCRGQPSEPRSAALTHLSRVARLLPRF